MAYICEGFLNARGCISLTWSPLSQWILDRLAFLISASCSLLNLPGLAALS